MNVKIKSTDVWNLIGDKYDQVYAALRKQLGDGDDQIFAQRQPGHEYLQWELPGDGWTALGSGDPLMEQEVRQQLTQRRQAVSQRFGANEDMAQRVLSVPAESYIYYKRDGEGRLLIRLTAWGYRNPDRVIPIESKVSIGSPEVREHVVITLTYDGKPLAGKAVKLNDLSRATDVKGQLDLSELPVGYEFTLQVDGQQHHFTVQQGQGNIELDLTRLTTVQVEVLKDGQPLPGATASVAYMGRQLQLTTDGSGRATVRLPLDLEGGLCSVSVEEQAQHLALSEPLTTFTFSFTSPEPALPEKEDVPPADKTEPLPPPELVKEPALDENGRPLPDPDDKWMDHVPTVVEEPPVDVPPPVEDNPPVQDTPPAPVSPMTYIGEALLALAIVALVVYTYYLCTGMLFGG